MTKAAPLIIGWLSFFAFIALPIQTEVYGDTRTILRQWVSNTQLPPLASLIDLRLHQNDAALTQVLLRTLAHTFSISIERAFRLTSAISGAFCLALWTQFVFHSTPHARWRPLLLITGLTLGANQIFFSHVETYAFVHLTGLMFLLSGYLLLERKLSAWLVCILFLVAVKAHASALCYAPGLIFLGIATLGDRIPRLTGLLVWRRVIPFLVIPSLILGITLYLVVFRSATVVPSSQQSPLGGLSSSTFSRTFLPIVVPHGWRDYALFAPAHLLDFANVLLLVGMPAVIILIGIAVLHRQAIDWQHPTIIFAVLTLLFPLAFFFAVNPLLSMPRDWDMYALLAGPILLLLAALLSHAREAAFPAYRMTGISTAFAIFSIGLVAMNASRDPLSTYLERVGEHVFRTYYTSASFIIGSAQGMDADTSRSLKRRISTIERLAPEATQNDVEYNHLLMMLATTYRARGDTADAITWVTRASSVSPDDINTSLFVADYLLWANRAPSAETVVMGILERNPSQRQALVLAAILAARRQDYGSALGFLERADKAGPPDPNITSWKTNVKRMAERRPTMTPTQ